MHDREMTKYHNITTVIVIYKYIHNSDYEHVSSLQKQHRSGRMSMSCLTSINFYLLILRSTLEHTEYCTCTTIYLRTTGM